MRLTGYKTAHGIGPARIETQQLIFHHLPSDALCMWDVGAGSGSIGIEWQKLHPQCFVYAIEKDEACVQAIRENALMHDTLRMQVIHRDITDGLEDLPQPDAIYHGCVSWTDINWCPVLWDYLAPGGTILAVVGQNRGEQYVQEAVRTLGGRIDWSGSGELRFPYWVAKKPF